MRVEVVRIYNLIPFLSGRADGIKRLEGRPETVLASLRDSCEQKGRTLASWAQGIEEHCPLPLGHPFRLCLARLPESHPLRTLGSWAFGAGTSWITIEELSWDDGSVSHPQEDHRKWLQRQSAALYARRRES